MAKLNLSRNREITRIMRDMAESREEILTTTSIICALSIKLIKDIQLLRINDIEHPL